MSLIVNVGASLSISRGFSIQFNKSSPAGPTPLPTPTPTPTPTATPTPTPTPTATPTPTPTPTATPTPTPTPSPTPTPTPTPAPLSANNIAFVGSNNYSGNGTNTSNYDYFTNIQTVCAVSGPVGYNAPHEFKQLNAFGNTGFALSADGTVYITGLNTLGWFGISGGGAPTSSLWYRPLTSCIDGTSYVTYPKFTKIVLCEPNAAVVLLSGNDAYSAGTNSTAKVGRAGDLSTYIRINGKWDKAAPVNGSLYMISGSDLYFSGANNLGQTGYGTSPTTYATITRVYSGNTTDVNIIGTSYLGGYHMLSAGKLYGTGYNFYGQLGTGNNSNRTTWTQVTVVSADDGQSLIINPTFTKFPSIFNMASVDHCMVLSGKRLFSCGRNFYSQLGLGDSNDRNIFTPVVSAKLAATITSADQIVINPQFDDVLDFAYAVFAISGTSIFFAGDTSTTIIGSSPYSILNGPTTIFTLLTNTPFISGISSNSFNATILKTYTS
jgi:alpha-tubulin suppressor-like RCC1 family protein